MKNKIQFYQIILCFNCPLTSELALANEIKCRRRAVSSEKDGIVYEVLDCLIINLVDSDKDSGDHDDEDNEITTDKLEVISYLPPDSSEMVWQLSEKLALLYSEYLFLCLSLHDLER